MTLSSSLCPRPIPLLALPRAGLTGPKGTGPGRGGYRVGVEGSAGVRGLCYNLRSVELGLRRDCSLCPTIEAATTAPQTTCTWREGAGRSAPSSPPTRSAAPTPGRPPATSHPPPGAPRCALRPLPGRRDTPPGVPAGPATAPLREGPEPGTPDPPPAYPRHLRTPRAQGTRGGGAGPRFRARVLTREDRARRARPPAGSREQRRHVRRPRRVSHPGGAGVTPQEGAAPAVEPRPPETGLARAAAARTGVWGRLPGGRGRGRAGRIPSPLLPGQFRAS